VTDSPAIVSPEADPAAWDAFVSALPDASVYHASAFRRDFENAFDHECVYLSARRGASIVGVLPLVSLRTLPFGRFLVSLPFFNYGGVVTSDEEAARALLARATEEARLRKARHVELRRRCGAWTSMRACA
jgi:hypothetical protein